MLLVTILVQGTVPALTARFGQPPVLVAGLLAIGLPSPLYSVDDGLGWLCALSAVRGAGFAVLTVLGSTLAAQVAPLARRGDRKSTRLNSSHANISYAVFCLKKKKNNVYD